MHCRRQDLDPRLYWLVEHLDAALAAGDQLMSLSLEVTEPTPTMGPRRLRTRVARFIRFVSQVRNLEDNQGAGRGRLPDAGMRKKMDEFWASVPEAQ